MADIVDREGTENECKNLSKKSVDREAMNTAYRHLLITQNK